MRHGTGPIASASRPPGVRRQGVGSSAEIAAWEKSGRLTVQTAPDPGQPRAPLTFDQMMDVWGELIDRSRFTRVDVVQTHPRALINEMIIENPYYIEPEAYLAHRERQRRGLPGIPAPEEAKAFLDIRPAVSGSFEVQDDAAADAASG